MTIQLRYSTGKSPWVFIPVKATKKNFDALASDAYNGERTHTDCDWRHLFSYLLSDKEIAKSLRNRGSENLRQNVVTFMFKAQYSGITHSDLHIVVSDTGGDNGAIVCGNIGSEKVWRSILHGFEIYLREQINKNEPKEYSFSFRYSTVRGVSKRESQENTFWAFTNEDGRRKTFNSKLVIDKIFSE